jgi:GAF domain-containing protein
MAVYFSKHNVLVPEFVSGENLKLFSSLRIPLGEGVSGWVAQNHKPTLNGNPSVEPGYLNDPTKYSTLRSALALPLEGSTGVAAVLALYRVHQDTKDDLRVLEAFGAQLGPVIESAARPKAAGIGAGAH